MFTILTARQAGPELVAELKARNEEEWGQTAFSKPDHLIETIPPSILAVDQAGNFLGGLTFTSALSPETPQHSIWVNTLLVSPPFRRQGIGFALIRAAEAESQKLGLPRLYVLSAFPGLYRALGWEDVKQSAPDKQTILKKTI